MAHTMYSPEHRRRVTRRLDRRNRHAQQHEFDVQKILTLMRKRGVVLHKLIRPNRIIWTLSNGIFVPSEIADALLGSGSVVGVGDGLFGVEMSQRFRFIEI